MVGLLRRAEDRVPSHFRATGDRIVIVGATEGALGGSAYWAELCNFVGGEAPRVNLDHETRLQQFLVAAAAARLLRSAHDCSEGGLAVALAEAAIGGPYAERGFGAIVDLRTYAPSLTAAQVLYGEDHGRVVLSVAPSALPGLRAMLTRHGLRGYLAGEVRAPGGELEIALADGVHRWPIDRLRSVYDDAIPRRMREVVSDRAEA
jgi:phosphoribosylformylglycinamidine synthase